MYVVLNCLTIPSVIKLPKVVETERFGPRSLKDLMRCQLCRGHLLSPRSDAPKYTPNRQVETECIEIQAKSHPIREVLFCKLERKIGHYLEIISRRISAFFHTKNRTEKHLSPVNVQI